MSKPNFAGRFDQLHEMAIQATGLDDFGSNDYHDPLRVMLDAVDTDVLNRLTPNGDAAAMGYIMTPLISRLYTQDGWNKHPEYKQVSIKKPVVILGLPRTGTTVLHKLLSVDPQFQSVPMWIFQRPMVRPPEKDWANTTNHQLCTKAYEASFAGNEDLNKFHDMVLDEADECWWGLQQSYVCDTMYAGLGLPSYASWWNQQDEHESYRRYSDLLRLIGLNDNRSWLLKNPYHLIHAEPLLASFPDACIIQTHRDPCQSVPSFSNLLNTSHKMYFEDSDMRPKQTGMIEAMKWSQGAYRCEAARKHHPDNFFDVLHRDFLSDPIKVVKSIYQRFDLTLTEETEQAMEVAVSNQDQQKKQGFSYNLEEFGLLEGSLRELFATYTSKYDL